MTGKKTHRNRTGNWLFALILFQWEKEIRKKECQETARRSRRKKEHK